jgi:hypothetical protein
MLLLSLLQLTVIDVHRMYTVADVPSVAKNPDVTSDPSAVACP